MSGEQPKQLVTAPSLVPRPWDPVLDADTIILGDGADVANLNDFDDEDMDQ